MFTTIKHVNEWNFAFFPPKWGAEPPASPTRDGAGAEAGARRPEDEQTNRRTDGRAVPLQPRGRRRATSGEEEEDEEKPPRGGGFFPRRRSLRLPDTLRPPTEASAFTGDPELGSVGARG